MHSIRIHKVIALIISLFYFVGVWHRGDKPTVKEIRMKLFYSIYYPLYVLSFAVGAVTNEKNDVSIFLAEVSIGVGVMCLKLWVLIWKQNEILDLLNRVCVFSIRNDDDYNLFTEKLRGFIKFVIVFVTATSSSGFLSSGGLTFLGNGKELFLEIAFPLDYKNNEIGFWIALMFLFTENILTLITITFNVIIWYLLLICSLRYEVLGSELKNMGQSSEYGNTKTAKVQMHKNFFQDLKTSISNHLHLRELTSEVELFFSDLFLIQFATSALCICGSTYCLAFDVGDNLPERFIYLVVFFYFISEIFMITYFGNEIIMLTSNRLSYRLFESDWYNQPQLPKKCIIIFGEYLKQPQELVIGKLYPLTLMTFTRILNLNSAYSMFNILQNFQ